MEWQVGQWVTVRGSRPCRIVSVNGQNLCVENNRMGKWQVNANKPGIEPFQWKIGCRYKTTMDGITAMIIESGLRTVAGKLSTGYGLGWLNTTGMACGYDETSKNAPHLLPLLADEPSEPEPTLTEQPQLDPINPQHYRDHPSGVECIQVAEHMPYCVGNAMKYLWRAGKKGDAIEDLKKASWYVNREIERLAKGGAA